MSEEIIVRYSWNDLPEDTRTDWARLKAMTEAEIEANALSDPDNLPMDVDAPEFAQRAALFHGARRLARLNLDPDLLDWFRRQSDDYRARMGAVLQAYMEANTHLEPARAGQWKKKGSVSHDHP